MNDKRQLSHIRRVLVALGSSLEDHSKSLQTGAQLAAALQADLTALYVLDINLIRFAGLPFATELISHSGSERRIDPISIEKELDAQAQWVSRELARLAEQQKLKWTLKTVRGHAETEILAASKQADLLIVGRSAGRMLVNRDQLGSTAAILVTKSQKTVVLLEEQNHWDRVSVVLVENMDAGRKALATAVRLSSIQDQNSRKLIVLLCALTSQIFDQLKADVDYWLRGYDRQAEFIWLRKIDSQVLAHRLWQQGGGILILSAETPFLKQYPIALLMRQLKLPLVLVR